MKTAIYLPTLGKGCEYCKPQDGDCDKHYLIDTKGQLRRRDVVLEDDKQEADAVITWPGCPFKFLALRRWGQDVVTIDKIVQWSFDKGVHRDPLLGSGGERLIRFWREHRERPAAIAEARSVEKMRQAGNGNPNG